MNNASPLVEMHDVWKHYDAITAVAGLSFDLRPGRVVGLLGHNGAGKTTAIRMILHILQPDRGEIRVLGRHVDPTVKDRIGYLPEERGLYKKMKVEDLLVFFGVMKGMRKAEARRETRRWLQRLELDDRRRAALEDFSKGMQQKVQFIATVIHRPPLLILDEPMSGLDPVNAQAFEDIMVELRNQGTGILFSTHILEQAERLLDDVIMLREGATVVQGELSEVKRQFGAGWIEVRGKGCGELLEGFAGIIATQSNGRSMRYRLAPDLSPRRVLEHLVRGGAEIEQFEELEASLRDIFLYRVGGIDVETLRKGKEAVP